MITERRFRRGVYSYTRLDVEESDSQVVDSQGTSSFSAASSEGRTPSIRTPGHCSPSVGLKLTDTVRTNGLLCSPKLNRLNIDLCLQFPLGRSFNSSTCLLLAPFHPLRSRRSATAPKEIAKPWKQTPLGPNTMMPMAKEESPLPAKSPISAQTMRAAILRLDVITMRFALIVLWNRFSASTIEVMKRPRRMMISNAAAALNDVSWVMKHGVLWDIRTSSLVCRM